jgi:plastocyanin
MILTRRRIIEAGGGILAAFVAGPVAAVAGEIVDVAMRGRADGSHVWFDPIGLHVQPGQTVRWTNRDPGNSHTVTSYHPAIFDRPLRIPLAAKPWNSDYLLPNESFSQTFTVEGVYDYYCVPHEHAGMVGRIVVGAPAAVDAVAGTPEAGLTRLPAAALNGFPPVEEIIAKGVVRRE